MRVVPRVKPRPLGDGVLFLEVEQVSKENEGYGSTLNLPATDFPMRAGLPKREPDFLTFWKEKGIYQKKLKAHAGHKKFILHDGPPYANGKIHLGHALNKILKDIILKYKYARGLILPIHRAGIRMGCRLSMPASRKWALTVINSAPLNCAGCAMTMP